jgi:small subunit ribosomal protein S6
MKNYELMFIIDATVCDEKREQLIEKFKALVESNNGKVVNEEKIGVKKFAYPINYKTEGYYVLMASGGYLEVWI